MTHITSAAGALIVSVLLTLSSSLALASGSKAGNGGHGVMCEGAIYVELLDLYEAREIYGMPRLFSPFNSTTGEIERLRFEMSLILPAGHAYLGIFDEALKLFESCQLVDGPLSYTPDVGLSSPVLPSTCELVQIARRARMYEQFVAVMVQKDYWQNMSPTEQALLLIHEASHEWFGSSDENSEFPSTLALRQIVGTLSSTSDYRFQKKALINRIVDTRVPAFKNEL
jgi:hypothetical protein